MELTTKTTKVLNVFLDNDKTRPKFIITFQLQNKELLRQVVSIRNTSIKGSVSYFNETPIVFIRNEDDNDLELLNKANILKILLSNNERVKDELSIKKTIKRALRRDMCVLGHSSHHNGEGEVFLRRPNKDFKAYTIKNFTDVARKIAQQTYNNEVLRK